jgi:hypothetical protein
MQFAVEAYRSADEGYGVDMVSYERIQWVEVEVMNRT